MEFLFIYLIKGSIGIVLFYAIYWLFLKKETFFVANRCYLIIGLILSILLPILPLHYSVLVEQGVNAGNLSMLSDTFENIPIDIYETTTNPISLKQILLLVYLAGFMIFLSRLLTQTFNLLRLIRKNGIQKIDRTRVVENEKYLIPFSFFSTIFINPKTYTQEELPEILAHEKVHIREKHWFDLLFIELLTVIFWFNPFIWFFEQAIKQNHEYLADRGVISKGYNVVRYQGILLNQLLGMKLVRVASNFNFALSKKRLKMMTKKKSSNINWMKFGWSIPILAILLFAFAKPEYKLKETFQTEEANVVHGIDYILGPTLMGKIVDENENPLPGVSIVVKGTSFGTVTDLNGEFKLELVEDHDLMILYVGKKSINEQYSTIVDDQENKKKVYTRNYVMKNSFLLMDSKYLNLGDISPVEKKDRSPAETSMSESKREVFQIVEKYPKYLKGRKELANYIETSLQEMGKSEGIKGKAKAAFTINKYGEVVDIKIVEKDNDNAAKVAFAIVDGLGDWNPGKQRGRAVPVQVLLPIEF